MNIWVTGCLLLSLLAAAGAAQASSTLRVGNQVLVAGDSGERVVQLLGQPAAKTHRRAPRAGRSRVRVIERNQNAEQWRYTRRGHVTVVTLVEGQVTQIDDRRL